MSSSLGVLLQILYAAVSVGGNGLPLPLADYLAREVKPDWRELPNQDDYHQAKSGQ